MKSWIYKFGYPIIKIYWFLFRPKTFGVKVLIEDNGEILLVRHTYGNPDWSFPGGGINKGEDPIVTARREVFEELGVNLKNPQLIGSYQSQKEYKLDTVYCFHGRADSRKLITDKNEIAEVGWFRLSSLPKSQPTVKMILKLRDSAR